MRNESQTQDPRAVGVNQPLGVHKYLFDTPFDTPVDCEDETVVVSASAWDKAKSEAFDQGFEQGGAHLRATEASKREEACLRVLEQMREDLGALIQERREFHHTLGSLALRCALDMVRKLFPHLRQLGGPEDVIPRMERILKDMPASQVRVRAHPDTIEMLKHALSAARIGPTPMSILFEGDETYALSDCCMSWNDTGVEILKDRLFKDVERLVHSLISVSPFPIHHEGA